MRRRVSLRTGPLSLNTRDTVATETSASRATSLIVALIPELLPAAERPARPHAQAVSLYGSPRWIADVTVYIGGIVRTLTPGCQAAVTASLPGLGTPRQKGARRHRPSRRDGPTTPWNADRRPGGRWYPRSSAMRRLLPLLILS